MSINYKMMLIKRKVEQVLWSHKAVRRRVDERGVVGGSALKDILTIGSKTCGSWLYEMIIQPSLE